MKIRGIIDILNGDSINKVESKYSQRKENRYKRRLDIIQLVITLLVFCIYVPMCSFRISKVNYSLPEFSIICFLATVMGYCAILGILEIISMVDKCKSPIRNIPVKDMLVVSFLVFSSAFTNNGLHGTISHQIINSLVTFVIPLGLFWVMIYTNEAYQQELDKKLVSVPASPLSDKTLINTDTSSQTDKPAK